ncbi:MAG: cytochrome P450 [Actinomycetota bacterium]
MTDAETAPASPDETLDRGSLFFLEAFDPANLVDPYPLYARTRATDPILDGENNLWFTFTHGAAHGLLRSRKVSSDERRGTFFQQSLADGTLPGHVTEREPFMLFLDPPDHDRLRGLVNKAFTQRRVDAMVKRIAARTDALLSAEAFDGGPVDIIEHLAYPLPVAVICEMLGVPESDHVQFGAWSDVMTKSVDPAVLRTEEDERAIASAAAELDNYIAALAAARRAAPTDDLLSALLSARDGEDQLSERELISLVVLLLIAGHETTVNLIGNGTVALLRNQEQLARWQADPTLAKSATDELLRYDSPVQFAMRIMLEETEIEGALVPPGDQVIVLLGAANRDPAMFEDPDRLDLGRSNAARHLSFGGGIHHCLGMALARIEGQIALGSLVSRFRTLTLAEEPPIRDRMVLRGYDRILVELGR